MRKQARFFASLVFILLLWSFDVPAAERLRVAFPSLGIALSPSWVTLEKGLWRKYGLDVELILLSGGARTVPALLSGSVQILLASDPTVTQAIAQGTDLIKLGVTTNTFGAALLTQPDIRSVKELKGKVLGVARGRDASYARLIKLLRDNGINPNEDVKLLAIGEGPGARLNALKAKVIQGTILSPPLDLVGTREGLRVLEKLDVPTPAGGITTTANFLRQNRPVLVDFLKGYIEGIHYLLTRKDESIKILSRYLRNPDMTVVGYFYDEIAHRAEKDLRPAPESVRFLNELVALDEPKAKQLTETDHWDLSLIEQIRKSGFVDQLYRN